MLEILELVHGFPPASMAGTELYTLNLARAFQRRGHRVTVLHPISDPAREPYSFEEHSYDGVAVVRCNVPELEALYSNVPEVAAFHNRRFHHPFAEFLARRHVDLLHVQHVVGLSAGCIGIAHRLGLKVALKVDDMFFYCPRVHLVDSSGRRCTGPESIAKCLRCLTLGRSELHPALLGAQLASRRRYLRRVFATADLVHTPSHYLRRECRRYGFDCANFRVVRTGIEPYELLRRTRGSAGLRIGFVGMIAWRKGIMDFMRAIELHVGRLPGTSARFYIYGVAEDDGPLARMLELAKTLPQVEHRGPFQPRDRARIFADLDLLVLPSRGEHYPFVLREAFFAGVPVVASRVGAIPELITDGKNGLLFEPGDVEMLAAILSRVDRSPDILRQITPDPATVRLIDDEAGELLELFGRLGAPRLAPDRLAVRHPSAELRVGDHHGDANSSAN